MVVAGAVLSLWTCSVQAAGVSPANIAALMAQDSGQPIEGFMEYAEKLAVTLNNLPDESLEEVLGPVSYTHLTLPTRS